ncbi:dual specificity protein phosphatase family protein [Maribacter ulvicola]|uniref:Dual specificity phosphatase, catalytic domain n=1 Tax=Maribacter ulvicola TaxID=228959 RepID=A0A1N6UDJ7_9FLAO|nr:dual specificity protein phosphatase family protein [Maribacter ulvicola]SIQ63660.1 Dual specificity phosphatase, catalytic domain [Maribacter ulvicola]
MLITKKYYYITLFSFLSFSFSVPLDKYQESNFKKIPTDNFHNLYKLNDSLYRSEQPSKKGMRELQAMGIQSIVNLRRQATDEKKIKGLHINLERIPLKASTIDFDDVFNALNSIQQAKKPVLVHCWHGSDRTGVIVAASRMVFDNWSKEKAIAEFTDKRFGYHRTRFPNLITLLASLDVELLKEKLAEVRMVKSN